MLPVPRRGLRALLVYLVLPSIGLVIIYQLLMSGEDDGQQGQGFPVLIQVKSRPSKTKWSHRVEMERNRGHFPPPDFDSLSQLPDDLGVITNDPMRFDDDDEFSSSDSGSRNRLAGYLSGSGVKKAAAAARKVVGRRVEGAAVWAANQAWKAAGGKVEKLENSVIMGDDGPGPFSENLDKLSFAQDDHEPEMKAPEKKIKAAAPIPKAGVKKPAKSKPKKGSAASKMKSKPNRPQTPDKLDGSNALTSADLLKLSRAASAKQLSSKHTRLPNGLLMVNPRGRHPIYDLIVDAHKAWDAKMKKQSKTLIEAAKEYRRRYHRNPPKGFDLWWDYVSENKVQLPDEYDQIHRDLEPFYGLTSSNLLALQSKWESLPGTYVIECDPFRKGRGCYLAKTNFETETEEGVRAGMERAEGQLSLLSVVPQALKQPLRVTYYAHDVPFAMAGHEWRSTLVDAAGLGEHVDPDDHEHDLAHVGWASACAPHKPIYSKHDPDQLPDHRKFFFKEAKSFIWDHQASMDPCEHPQLTQIVGALSSYGKGPRPQDFIYPVLAMCTTKLHSDVLTVAMEQFTEAVGQDPPWEDKTADRLLWRGSTTGILLDEGLPWNISQRMRLVEQAALRDGKISIIRPLEPTDPVGIPEPRDLANANELYMDVSFVERPIQCGSDAVCEEVAKKYTFSPRQGWDAANEYKYIFDIDGNGWSARFKRLISTNSLILKTTIFPEWYQDRIMPWVHYVPVNADLSDLYDIMAFFRGDDEEGTHGHDSLAKEIATAGRDWSAKFWRREDMVAYLFRLYLEYARITAPNRDEMDFVF